MTILKKFQAILMFWLCPLQVLGQANVTEERVLAESGSGENWFVQGGNFRGEHYSPLDQVNDGNVSELGLTWATDLPIKDGTCLLYTSPSPRDGLLSRMPSSA